MSAWLCSQDHINLLANSNHWCDDRKAAFDMLLEENLRSLRHRYAGRDFLQEYEDEAKGYTFERVSPIELIQRVYAEQKDRARYYPAVTQPVTLERLRAQVITSCHAYDYQACETDDYRTTPAARFVRAILEETPLVKEKLLDEALWSF